MSLLLAQSSPLLNRLDVVGSGNGDCGGFGVLVLIATAPVDAVGQCTGIAEVWGVVVDGNELVFDESGVRLMYRDDPPNRFWPTISLKPY